ncbi:MAG: TonB-dependent siderophore receptor [Cyanobacteria bacterium P01_G01_bin.39]
MKLLSVFLFRFLTVSGLLTVSLGGIIAVRPVQAEQTVRAEEIEGEERPGRKGRHLDTEMALVEKSPNLQIPPPSTSQPSLIDSKQQNNISYSAADLLAQGVTRVTGVEVVQTDEGLELVLKTVAGSERLVPLILPEGNDLVIELLDATLAFAIRNGVTEVNPAPGISRVTVNPGDENSIRVRITGENQAPSAEILPGRDNLVLSVTTDGTTTADDPDDSINVIATGQGAEDEYFVPDASTATRTDTPIRDIPQSIQVIPRQVIEDQQAIELEEVLNNVSGVTTGGTNGGNGESFNIRGFSGAPVLRDGFRQFDGVRDEAFTETANLERVEVLKGPASILYGEIEPGGVINLVTKKPVEEGSLYKATLQFGDDALVSPSIDFSDSLTADGSLRYRLNALYRHENSFRDFDEDFERFFVAPVISWEIGDRTDITFQLDYTDSKLPSDLGLPASGDSIDVPFDTLIDEPTDMFEQEVINVGYNLEHRFSDNWKLRNAFRFSDRDIDGTLTVPLFFDADTGLVTRVFAGQDTDIQNYSLQTNVEGEFDTGSIEHTLLFGIDLQRSDFDEIQLSDFTTDTLNIFDPVFGTFDDVDPDDLPVSSDFDTQRDRLGIFLQDQIDILDNLILLAGLRYDTVEQTIVTGPTDFDPEISEEVQNDDDFIPRVGLVYQPIPQISLFGSYSESFSPNDETDSSGDILEPEVAEGFEFGIKGEILEGKLSATLGYFNITKKNVAVPDPEDFFFSVASGEQQSQGIELDIIGEIMPGWNIVASYAYIDAEITEDEPDLVGNRLFNTPENSASLWTTYEIQQGSLQGLGFGGGFVFVGERQGDLANSFAVDDYFLTNAALFYKRDNWRLALNFENLFDVDYIVSTFNRRESGNEVGDPFSVIGSVSMEF